MLLATSLLAQVRADEGMWLMTMLEKLNYKDMKKAGVKLTPEQIYSVNNSSLKDAIGWFGNGCTSEMVSEKGLVFTNHHCGYDAIAGLSTPADNILDNGFWAKSLAEERPAPGLTIAMLDHIEDITAEVLDSVKNMDPKTRNASINRIFASITARATKGTHFEATCREMFSGNAYYLFVFERYTDVRLVGTPPQNIGKFGGETDNWMWPRHTGDFSVFRIYCGADGKPAPYAASNVPYKPKHFLPVSLKGIDKGDFAMIIGYPGSTSRYEFSQGVELAQDVVDPFIVKLRDVRLNAWKTEMNQSIDVKLKLASDFASVANYWKYFRGESEQLKQNKVYQLKQQEEAAFQKMIKADAEFRDVLGNVDQAYKDFKPYALQRIYLREGLSAPHISKYVSFAMAMEAAVKSGDSMRIDRTRKQIIEAMGDLPYTAPIVRADKRIFDSLLVLYMTNIPAGQHPAYFNKMLTDFAKGGTERDAIRNFTDHIFNNSLFADRGMFEAWINNPRTGIMQNDPMYQFYKAFLDHYNTNYKSKYDEFTAQVNELRRLYIKGLMKYNTAGKYYPDANSSMRLTYGTVKPYLKYPLFTNLDEVVDKYNKYYVGEKNNEFQVPQNLLDAHKARNYGRYADKKGKLPVCFLTNNDITGGNSGSPVMNANGELIGLAFDGNWEAMSGKIDFDEKLQRTICVDIRYVLWNIEVLGGAKNIVDELKIVQ